MSGQPGRATVANINDLEAEGVQYASGAVYASAEIVGTEGPAGRVPVSDTENGLGVVLFVVEDQQIGAGVAEAVAGEELVWS